MKKFALLPLIAAATLGLVACAKPAPTDNQAAANEVALNSEAPILDTNVIDESAAPGNEFDNASAPVAAGNVVTN